MAIPNWVQVNKDGFGYPLSYSAVEGGKLFSSANHLYAWNEYGLFRMDNIFCKTWQEVFIPAEYLILLDNTFYSYGPKGLWFIDQGEEFYQPNWKKVTSKGISGGAFGTDPIPKTIFNGKLYGVCKFTDSDVKIFEIWRTADIGKTTMNWENVVFGSFLDWENNNGVDFMCEFNSKIYAGTNTLKTMFGGVPTTKGVEIWESASGDEGTWTQVNKDGFGTEITPPTNKNKMRIHHVIGSWVIFKAPNQNQEYLYIGTKSHWGGAEVWRYDGKGKGGWKNVTPSWAGPSAGGLRTTRNESMVVFKDNMYLAEGYYTGNLAKYDGANWSIVVNGPNPFDPQNGGLISLAVFQNHLYAHTTHAPFSGATKGDQVWGYPFSSNLALWTLACMLTSWWSWWKIWIETHVLVYLRIRKDISGPP